MNFKQQLADGNFEEIYNNLLLPKEYDDLLNLTYFLGEIDSDEFKEHKDDMLEIVMRLFKEKGDSLDWVDLFNEEIDITDLFGSDDIFFYVLEKFKENLKDIDKDEIIDVIPPIEPDFRLQSMLLGVIGEYIGNNTSQFDPHDIWGKIKFELETSYYELPKDVYSEVTAILFKYWDFINDVSDDETFIEYLQNNDLFIDDIDDLLFFIKTTEEMGILNERMIVNFNEDLVIPLIKANELSDNFIKDYYIALKDDVELGFILDMVDSIELVFYNDDLLQEYLDNKDYTDFGKIFSDFKKMSHIDVDDWRRFNNEVTKELIDLSVLYPLKTLSVLGEYKRAFKKNDFMTDIFGDVSVISDWDAFIYNPTPKYLTLIQAVYGVTDYPLDIAYKILYSSININNLSHDQLTGVVSTILNDVNLSSESLKKLLQAKFYGFYGKVKEKIIELKPDLTLAEVFHYKVLDSYYPKYIPYELTKDVDDFFKHFIDEIHDSAKIIFSSFDDVVHFIEGYTESEPVENTSTQIIMEMIDELTNIREFPPNTQNIIKYTSLKQHFSQPDIFLSYMGIEPFDGNHFDDNELSKNLLSIYEMNEWDILSDVMYRLFDVDIDAKISDFTTMNLIYTTIRKNNKGFKFRDLTLSQYVWSSNSILSFDDEETEEYYKSYFQFAYIGRTDIIFFVDKIIKNGLPINPQYLELLLRYGRLIDSYKELFKYVNDDVFTVLLEKLPASSFKLYWYYVQKYPHMSVDISLFEKLTKIEYLNEYCENNMGITWAELKIKHFLLLRKNKVKVLKSIDDLKGFNDKTLQKIFKQVDSVSEKELSVLLKKNPKNIYLNTLKNFLVNNKKFNTINRKLALRYDSIIYNYLNGSSFFKHSDIQLIWQRFNGLVTLKNIKSIKKEIGLITFKEIEYYFFEHPKLKHLSFIDLTKIQKELTLPKATANIYMKLTKLLLKQKQLYKVSSWSNHAQRLRSQGKDNVFRIYLNSEKIILDFLNKNKLNFNDTLYHYISAGNGHPTEVGKLTLGWVRFEWDKKANSIFITEIQTDLTKILGYDNSTRKISNDLNNKIAGLLLNRFIQWRDAKIQGTEIILPTSKYRKEIIGGEPTKTGYDNNAKKQKMKKKMMSDTVWMQYTHGKDSKVFYENKKIRYNKTI